MEPANDPAVDYRALVALGYDACAERYSVDRAKDDAGELAPLLARLVPRSRVLDLGCGTGVPVSRALADAGHDVVGVDISAGQLAVARRQAITARLVRGDMSRLAFVDASFDAVVSFYAIFHLPRELHAALFVSMHGWLKPGGWLFASVSFPDEAAYIEEFFGVDMYWSNYGLGRYREMLRDAGFIIEQESILSHGYDTDARPEAHPLLLARRA
jgi:cyclopropane fatty-acyl-phospholipid synthase-like methyltransferase